MSLWAAGPSGDYRGDAYPFDWENAHKQKGTVPGVTKWYNVDITRVLEQKDPTLALYVTNMSETASAHVEAAVFVGTSNSTMGEYEFDLEPGQFRIMSRNVSALRQFNYTSVYIRMKVAATTDTVALSAKALETRRIDNTCQNSTQLHVGDPAHPEASGTLKWFNFSLEGYKSGHDINVKIKNTSASSSTIQTEFSYDCPSTGTTDRSENVASGAETVITLPVAVLEAISETRAYFSVKASGAYSITIEAVEQVVIPEPVIPSFTAYDWESAGVTLPSGTNWYEFDCDSMVDDLRIPWVMLEAPTTAGAEVSSQLAYIKNNQFIVLASYDWSFTGSRTDFELDVNELMALYSFLQGGKVYYGLTTAIDDVRFKMTLNSVTDNTDCLAAQVVSPADQIFNLSSDADWKAWYAINLVDGDFLIKDDNSHKDLQLVLSNLEEGHGITVYTMPASCSQQNIDRKLLEKVELGARYSGTDQKTIVLHEQFLDGLNDKVYFYIEANGKCKLDMSLEAAEAYAGSQTCDPQTDFDWRYGHSQTEQEVWYKVSKDTLEDYSGSPVLYISNRDGDNDVTVSLQYAFACPVPGKLQNPINIPIPAGKDTAYVVSRGLLDNFSSSKDWFLMRLTTDVATPDLYLQMTIADENELASKMCESAVDFNWLNGNTQAADTTLWYKVDLAYPKAQGNKIIKLHIDNMSETSTAHVTADLVFECPYQGAPTSYNATIAPGATRPEIGSNQGLISYGMYENKEAVWVRLKSDQKVHMWVELEDDNYEKDTVCEIAELLYFDTRYTLTKDTTWYYFISDSLRSQSWADTTWVPQITIVNPTGEKVELRSEVSFHCPVTSTPIGGTRSVAAHDSIVKVVERDFVNGYVTKYDTFFVRILGTDLEGKNIQFEANMIDPNKGADCYHAINFPSAPGCHDLLKTRDTVWYKMDVRDLRGRQVTATLLNNTAVTQNVSMAIFLNCDGEPLEQASKVSGAHTSFEKEIGELLSGLRFSNVYMRVVSEDSLVLRACIGDELPKGDSIHVCDKAVKAEPNIHYHQEANDTVWYYIDVAALRDFLESDAKLTVTPECGTVNISVKQWWACETDEHPTAKGQTISTEYERTITRQMIDGVEADSIFLMITADKCFTFIVEAESSKGKLCEDAIEFDWDNCNAHPKDKSLWYHFELDNIPADKDIKMTIYNLENYPVTAKFDSVLLSCGAENLMDIGNKTIAAYPDSMVKFIDNTLIQDFLNGQSGGGGNAGISIKVSANGEVRICPELVDALQDSVVYDTIYREICIGNEFIDPNFTTKKDSANIHNHYMAVLTDSICLNDTVHFRYDGTFQGDSIRTYRIYPIDEARFAQPITVDYLQSLTLEAGRAIDADKRAEILLELLDSVKVQPYVSWIDSTKAITWEVTTVDIQTNTYGTFSALTDDYTSPFADELYNGNTRMALRLNYQDKCENMLVDTMFLTFTDNMSETLMPEVDTVCAGYPFRDLTINVDTVISDTVLYNDDINKIRTDTIYSHTFYIFTHELSALPTDYYPHMQAGMGIVADSVADAENALRTMFAQDNQYAPDVTSITWKYSESADKTADTYVAPETLSSTETAAVWMAYKVTTSCSDEIYDTIHVNLLAADTLQGVISTNICYGDSLQSRNGTWHIANVAEQIWSDTVHNVAKAGITDQKFDSIYVYTLTTLMPADSTPTWDLCEGYVDTTFFNTTIQNLAPGTYQYKDTLRTVGGCDSIWGVVNITVHPTVTATDSVALCKLETHQWGTKTYSWESKGRYTDTQTFSTVLGCDSVVTRIFNVSENDTVKYTRTICGGSVYSEYPFISEQYTVGGVYTKTVHTNNTCDSVYVLTLKVQATIREVKTELLCQGEVSQYTHIAYSQPGVYTDSISSPYSNTGCDSTRTVWNIIVSPKYSRDSIVEICQGESYYFNGQAYSTSGNYVESRTTVNGCDSIITLKLTVNKTFEIPVSGRMCDNASYTWLGHKNNIQYSGLRAGTYVFYDSLQTVKGCDSVYVLTLTVDPTYHPEVFDTICRGEEINLGGNGGMTAINRSGDYVENRSTVFGCDSIITHHVVVRSAPGTPDVQDMLDNLEVVCGEMLNFAKSGHNADSVVTAFYENDIIQHPEHETYADHKWQVLDPATREWSDIGSTNSYYYETGKELQFRYEVTTDCGTKLTSTPFVVVIEPPTNENVHYGVIVPVVPKYEGWLIVLNKVEAVRQLAAAGLPTDIDSTQVHWYRVVGEMDEIVDGHTVKPKTGDQPDIDMQTEHHPNGFYITGITDRLPAGQYYAVIEGMSMVEVGSPCDITIRTAIGEIADYGQTAPVVAPGSGGGSAPAPGSNDGRFRKLAEINPTVVAPGEPVNISNLNPSLLSTIEIYDVMGGRVDVIESRDVESFTYFTSTSRTGCFLVNVISEEGTTALKYMVR